jgi:hypothetical protein
MRVGRGGSSIPQKVISRTNVQMARKLLGAVVGSAISRRAALTLNLAKIQIKAEIANH